MLARRFIGLHHRHFIPRGAAKYFSACSWREYATTPRDGVEGLIYPEPATKLHSDLPSFLSHAERTGLDTASTVYRGTLYEYTVGQSLARYGFHLRRVGGASDAGIDLLGTWALPRLSSRPGGTKRASTSTSSSSSSSTSTSSSSNSNSSSRTSTSTTPPRTLRVLVQCKFESKRPGPRHIRELEGSFAGAPAGWTGDGVVAFVVCRMPATKGMREALGRSGRPMGYLACEEGGEVLQMLWNGRAEEQGLGGLGVAMKRYEDGRTGELVLTVNGEAVPLLEGR